MSSTERPAGKCVYGPSTAMQVLSVPSPKTFCQPLRFGSRNDPCKSVRCFASRHPLKKLVKTFVAKARRMCQPVVPGKAWLPLCGDGSREHPDGYGCCAIARIHALLRRSSLKANGNLRMAPASYER